MLETISAFLELAWAHLDSLLYGALVTVQIAVAAIVFGGLVGLALCFGLLSSNRFVRVCCLVYQSAWRGTPILVQLLIVFYIFPAFDIEVPPLIAAALALTMNSSAFQAEIYRGGILSINRGQAEAGRILGLSTWAVRIRILIPQMYRLVMPSLVNETISILKNTSLVSVIGVTELMRVSQQVVSTTYRPLETYLAAALIYLVMNYCLSLIGRRWERRLSRGG
ncbi:MAG: amino acid ABC transporter permease [Halofilum sp. (in: g-proteobacteria)]